MLCGRDSQRNFIGRFNRKRKTTAAPHIQASFGKVNDQHDFHEITTGLIDTRLPPLTEIIIQWINLILSLQFNEIKKKQSQTVQC